jgi:hypothetical protein
MHMSQFWYFPSAWLDFGVRSGVRFVVAAFRGPARA